MTEIMRYRVVQTGGLTGLPAFMAFGAFTAERMGCGALAFISPGSPCGVPAARSSGCSVLGHLKRALSARGSHCSAMFWDAVAPTRLLCISRLPRGAPSRNVVGTLFLAAFGAPTRTLHITAPCICYIAQCGGCVPQEADQARHVKKVRKSCSRRIYLFLPEMTFWFFNFGS